MNPRGGRYPPGIGNGRGGIAGGNPNFNGRNPLQHQQYVQRNPVQGQQNQQLQQQQLQWSRRNQMGSDFGVSEAMKSVHSGSIDSSSQDWKAQLNIPPPDTRYRTEKDEKI